MQKLTEISPGESFEVATRIWQACGYEVVFHGSGRERKGACEPQQNISLRIQNYWKSYMADGKEVAGEWTDYVDAPNTFREVLDSVIDQWNDFVRKELGLPVAFDKGHCRCLRCSHEWQAQDTRVHHIPKRCAKCRSPLWNKPRQRKQGEKQSTLATSHLAAA